MSTEKYGVIFAPTTNIGDDIQTLAAINFLKKKGITDYSFLNREELHLYDGEELNLVMNGWFMRDPRNFPPSDKIKPIWISFNMSNSPEYMVSENIEYFKKQPPIGCRDQATVDHFNRQGIEAYLTGCLTLYFDKYENKGGKKYLVDVDGECNYVPSINLNKSLFKDFEIVNHETFKYFEIDVAKRIKLAKQFINNYQKASLVITSRLHCALPCRAFGTECVFIHKKYDTDHRFTGLKGILNGGADYHYNTFAQDNELEKVQSFFERYKL